MTNNPPASNTVKDNPGTDNGQTTAVKDGHLAPRLPHERDESSDSQSSTPDPMMQQAHADLARGLVDTDRGPVLDDVYEHQVRAGEGATRDRGAADEQNVATREGAGTDGATSNAPLRRPANASDTTRADAPQPPAHGGRPGGKNT